MASLILRIGADYSALTRSLQQAENKLKRFGFKAERIGQDLTTRLSLPIIAVGAAAVKAFSEFDRIEKGLSALGGSAQAGGEQFQRLNKIVLDTRTTLDLKTAALGAQRLQGAGLSAAFAERTIKQLGIAATVSGSAIDDVGGVLRQFTQIIGKGKIEQEDLNSILDRMPALGALLKQEFGGVTAEAIRNTGISMEEFVNRTVTAIEKNKDFQNVQGGLAKSFESFANAVQVGIAPLGEAIAKALNLEQNLQRLGDFITSTSLAFKNLDPGVQKFIVYTAGAAAATGPLIFGMGALAKALPLLRSGFALLASPITALIGKFGVLAKATRAYVLATTAASGSTRQLQLFTIALGPKLGNLATVMRTSAGRSILLGNGFKYAGRSLKALFLNPVGLAVAAVVLLALSAKRAYESSATFRNQVTKLGESFSLIIAPIVRLAKNLLPDLNLSFSGLGDVANLVFGGIAAGISFLVDGFVAFVNSLTLVGTAIGQIFSGDFSGAADSFSKTLFNPAVVIEEAKKAALTAVDVFNETVAGEPVDSPSSKTEGYVSPLDIGFDGSEFTNTSKGDENVNKYFGAFASLNLEVERSKAAFNAFGTSLAELPVLGGITGVNNLNQALADYGEGLEIISEKQAAFGGSYDGLTEKIGLTKSAITNLLEQGFSATTPQVQELIDKYTLLTAAQNEQAASTELANFNLERTRELMGSLGIESVSEKWQDLTTSMKAAGVGVSLVANIAQKAFSDTASGTLKLGQAVIKATRDIVGAFIQQGVAAVVAGALKSSAFLGPLAIPLGAAAGAGANTLFQSILSTLKIPALAEGGIATGPTLALIGEGSESEAILPLSKLQALMDMSGGGGGGVMEFRIDGDDLYAVVEAAGNRKSRFA